MSDATDKLKKMVSMVLMGVSQKEIAETFGIDESRVSQIKQLQAYKDLYEAESVRFVEENQKLNSTWDEVERQGLQIVTDVLKRTPDPDYALRVAAIANRALRRGQQGQQHQLPSHKEGNVAVQFNVQFLNTLKEQAAHQLESFGGSTTVVQDTGAQKRTNLLSPKSVTDMFLKPHEDLVDTNAA